MDFSASQLRVFSTFPCCHPIPANEQAQLSIIEDVVGPAPDHAVAWELVLVMFIFLSNGACQPWCCGGRADNAAACLCAHYCALLRKLR